MHHISLCLRLISCEFDFFARLQIILPGLLKCLLNPLCHFSIADNRRRYDVENIRRPRSAMSEKSNLLGTDLFRLGIALYTEAVCTRAIGRHFIMDSTYR